ncbi:DUF805 domain-containing protein [Streptomyces griseosporeus]|uniref:DUF805 domain-containing protein n=1 Tax=Streptomyces griseosporeus TaxID=1910 RepID=UPI00167E0540|nr:DUF805 domain-containing protein [Streptomyces griseosporeus]GHF50936.1 aminopeptidase [Streptomyces griseosporeus]
MHWYVDVLKNYAVFHGRARRQEYWMFAAFNVGIYIVLMFVDGYVGSEVASTLYSLAILLPSLGVTVRRLHDTDRSGWWCLIGLLPLVGFVVMLIFMATEGTPGQNKYGVNPKEAGVLVTGQP